MNKKIIIVFILFAIIIAGANIVTYAYSEKTLIDVFFNTNKTEQKDMLKKLLVSDGRSIEYDGYTFVLENELYDVDSGIGYCHFIVRKDGIDMRELYYDSSDKGIMTLFDSFGDEARFSIVPDGSNAKSTFKAEQDKLNVYVKFERTRESSDNNIYICDFKNKDTITEVLDHPILGARYKIAGKFELKDSKCSKKIKCENNKDIIITPFQVCLTNFNNEITDFTIIMIDGTSIQLVNDGEILKGLDYHKSIIHDNGFKQDSYVLKDILDYREVNNIIINGINYNE